MRGERIKGVLALMLAGLLLAACGSGGSGGTAAPGSALGGGVHGGQSPVSGSTITLYAAGSGSASATVLGSTMTNASGIWTLNGFTCPSPGTATYVIASGGNPGLTNGTNNSALQMMAALGPCGSLPNFVNIDELTTAAAVYALNGFIGPGGAGLPSGVSNVHGNDPGLANAMGNAARLASAANGGDSPQLPSASACAASSPPVNCGGEELLNSLANSLAACVNSSGPASAQCVELFDCATPGATYSGGACTVPGASTQAADTLTAALEIARNAGQVPAMGVYDVATRDPVFSPALSAAPGNWLLGLNISGGGLDAPNGIAIDAGGDAWVASNDALVEFSPAGMALSGSGGYTGGGLNGAIGVAIDAGGKVWVVNGGGSGSLSEFSSAGMPVSASAFTGGGIDGPGYDAIDPSGNIWIENFFSILSEFSSSGTPVSATGYTGNGLDYPSGIAIDSSGNVWVTNTGDNGGTASLSEFDSAGAAVGAGPITGGGLDAPTAVAVDPNGNLWVANGGNASLSEFSSARAPLLSVSSNAGGICDLGTLAIDAGGNVWVASGCTLAEFNSAGTALSPGYTGGGFAGNAGIAIDASGDVWTTNNSSNSVTELIGAAVPTRTPLVSAINSGFTP
jgi:streptogramin lyase